MSLMFNKKMLLDCINEVINEGVEGINLSTDNFDNMTVSKAAEVAKKIASQNSGVNVTLNGTTINSDDNANEKAQDIIDSAKKISSGSISEGFKCYTKKEINEMRLKYLKENAICVSKKDLK